MGSKENDRAMLNQISPGGLASFKNKTENWKPIGQMCSPVKEETIEEEEFTSDADAIEKRLDREIKPKRVTIAQSRRHSLAPKSSSQSRFNRSTLDKRHLSGDRRVSFGGVVTHSTDPYEAHVASELKDELTKRMQLDQTRQQRLNGMDIKLKQAKIKCDKLQEQCDQERRAKEAVQRQLADLKRSHKMLRETLRRKDEQLRKLGFASSGPASVSSIDSDSRRTSHGEFKDAEDMFSSSNARSHESVEAGVQRRYTMGPGEVSRLRQKQAHQSSNRVTINKDSRYVRVDSLDKGYNSQKLLDLVKEYGGIASLRVTSDVVTGVLKGYITFLSSVNAHTAIRGLREKGYKATLVDKA